MLQDVLNDSVVEAVKTAAPVIVKQQSEIVPIMREVGGNMLTPICVIAIIFGSSFAILRLYLRTWHERRMLMIEKGMVEVVKNVREPMRMVRIAFIVLGFMLGWVIGMLISNSIRGINDGIFAFALAWGGAAAGYLWYYYIFVWKKEKEQGGNS